jgi:hypothetical protein
MFPTSRLRALASCCAVVLVAVAFGCSKTADKGREKAANEAAASAGAGAQGGAFDDANAGAGGQAGASPSATDDSSDAGNDSADDECRSGQTRCHGQLGFQRCTPDNVWGPAQSCGGYSENGTSSYCAVFDAGDGTPYAACGDPACWWWHESGLDALQEHAGVCIGTEQLRRCVAGVLRQPEACAGTCQRVAELDGRVLGYCADVCQDGERECLGGSLYRECVAGRWTTEAQSCADGAECQPLAQNALPDIKCGGACEVGTSRCAEAGTAIESCSEQHEWLQQPPCMLGRCVQAAAQAQCQTECQPGEHACAFDGATAELVCSDVGLWNELASCQAGATCRIGTAGALGCVKCIGPGVLGGNVWGVADSHCDASGVAECGDGDYGIATPCSAERACVELSRAAASLAYCK